MTLTQPFSAGPPRAVAEESGGEALHRAVRTLIDSGAWRANGPADRRYNAEHHAVDVSVAAHLR